MQTQTIYRLKDKTGKTRARFTVVYEYGSMIDIIDSTATEYQISAVIEGGDSVVGSLNVTVEGE